MPKYSFTHSCPGPPGFAEARIRRNFTSGCALRKHALRRRKFSGLGHVVNSSKPIHVYWWPWYSIQSESSSRNRSRSVAPFFHVHVLFFSVHVTFSRPNHGGNI